MITEMVHRSDARSRIAQRGFVLKLATVTSLVLALAGCGSGTGTAESTVVGATTSIVANGESTPGAIPFSQTTYTVSVTQGKVNPATLDVPAGSGVLIINAEDDSTVQHELVADDGSFDTGVLDPGGQYLVMFGGQGTVTYHDALHSDITGEIVISNGNTSYGVAVPPPTGPFVRISNSGLSAATTRVKVGEPVTFYDGEDDNTVEHRIVADDGSFDTGVLSPGESYSVSFDSTGTYSYHDALDSSIKGTVIVS